MKTTDIPESRTMREYLKSIGELPEDIRETPRTQIQRSVRKTIDFSSQQNRSQSSNPVSKIPRGSAHSPLEKLRSVYQTMENKALYISPILDIKFSGGKECNVDEAGNQKMTIGEESYNSVLLYTVLATVLDDSKVIFSGPHGSGKTSCPRFVGSAIFDLLVDYIKHATIQGHPEQTEEKMVAMFDPISMMKGEKKLIIRDFVKSPIKLIDEINRLRPESLSILYELLSTGSITYQGNLIKATPGPLFATRNFSDNANFDLPPPLLDRFDIGIYVDNMNSYDIETFLKKRMCKNMKTLESKIDADIPITREDIAKVRSDIYSVSFPSEVLSKVAHFIAEINSCDMAGLDIEKKTKGNLSRKKPPALCQDCDHYSKDNSLCSKTENALSTRAVQSIYKYSKAVAYWRGKNEVAEEDVRAVIPNATAHRLVPTRAAFDIDARFVNDPMGMIRAFYDISSKNFDEIVNVFPEYVKITSLVASNTYNGVNGTKVNKKEIENYISIVGKLDTVAKYPLLTSLKKMYNNANN